MGANQKISKNPVSTPPCPAIPGPTKPRLIGSVIIYWRDSQFQPVQSGVKSRSTLETMNQLSVDHVANYNRALFTCFL